MSRVILVTGAGTGIGRAVALAFLAAGDKVVLAGRRREALEETAAHSTVGECLVVPTDVTRPDEIDRLFAKTADAFGRLDVLFNNAGVGAPPIPFEDLPLEAWEAAVGTNLTGVFLCAQHAFRLMKAQDPRGGRIINNGSISAHTPRPRSAAYTATKHAVTGLTRSISLDGREWDIACGQIDIGNAATPMTGRLSRGALQPNGEMLAEPLMDVKAVADAVLMMAALPLTANVQFMTVMATKMPYIGRG
jgi:NAD(P)-dependent dehydrogenase (short-subunit alcohol dehydrogenase family)